MNENWVTIRISNSLGDFVNHDFDDPEAIVSSLFIKKHILRLTETSPVDRLIREPDGRNLKLTIYESISKVSQI